MVKICGITNDADAIHAVEHGAGALGFNFWPHSPRFVDTLTAARIAAGLPVLKVGVFVNESAGRIAAVMREAALDVAQLHGDCGLPEGIRLWRAVSVKPGFDPASLDDPAFEAFLLDAPVGDLYGGGGVPFDWSLARGVRRRILVAGGLDAANVRRAIEAIRPWGVDACSRLESSPGRKDHSKVAAFLAAALANES